MKKLTLLICFLFYTNYCQANTCIPQHISNIKKEDDVREWQNWLVVTTTIKDIYINIEGAIR